MCQLSVVCLVQVLQCLCVPVWPWGVSGLFVVMLGSVVICILVGLLISFLVAFHLVLSIGELVAGIDC